VVTIVMESHAFYAFVS